MFAAASVLALALVSSVFAQPSPLTPVPVQEGGNCVITWTPDSTGKWNETNIELMTGDNLNMIHLTTVTTVDTTSSAAATFSWICPDVTLYAAVYFYQFSHATEPSNLIWTTRWAIASATDEIVGAPNATQPDGSAVGWGIGYLKDPSTAKPAPSYITGQTSGAAGAAAATNGTVVASVSASASSTMTMSVASKATGMSATSSATSSTAGTAVTGASTSGAGLLRSPASLFVAGAGAILAGLLSLV